jgi:Zn-dependent peptidase ImmA (M78 family)
MFARGFKTWCETCAMLQRRRLHLQPIDPLAPKLLAKVLGVGIHTAAEVPGLDAGVVAVLKRDSGSWSAVTISDGVHHVIVVNPWHSKGRTSSDTMHELAHVLRGHTPARVDITEDGSLILNTYDRDQEDEANWLAGCLLLPREALLHIRASWADRSSAATHYGVSMDLLTYRMNITGVENQFKRAHRHSARRA